MKSKNRNFRPSEKETKDIQWGRAGHGNSCYVPPQDPDSVIILTGNQINKLIANRSKPLGPKD